MQPVEGEESHRFTRLAPRRTVPCVLVSESGGYIQQRGKTPVPSSVSQVELERLVASAEDLVTAVTALVARAEHEDREAHPPGLRGVQVGSEGERRQAAHTRPPSHRS